MRSFVSEVAIAAFVKTPGLSPLKTRLAADIGRPRADRFYELAVASIESMLLSMVGNGFAAFWAVAESAAVDNPRWARLPRLVQGSGSLGDRLAAITKSLHERYRSVIVIGADSPQLTPEEVLTAATGLTFRPHRPAQVIGRTYDGGFYLFGSNYLLADEAWRNASLGHKNAAETLLQALDPSIATGELPRRVDVDSAIDLPRLKAELLSLEQPSAAQIGLLSWLDEPFSPELLRSS